jgi:hypothetical protein
MRRHRKDSGYIGYMEWSGLSPHHPIYPSPVSARRFSALSYQAA